MCAAKTSGLIDREAMLALCRNVRGGGLQRDARIALEAAITALTERDAATALGTEAGAEQRRLAARTGSSLRARLRELAIESVERAEEHEGGELEEVRAELGAVAVALQARALLPVKARRVAGGVCDARRSAASRSNGGMGDERWWSAVACPTCGSAAGEPCR